jgi:hypothetical protein
LEPACSLYDRLIEETRLRGTRSPDEWVLAEREAMHAQANLQAGQLGLGFVSMEDVMRAERQALGHADYCSKWAIKLANIMLGHA